MPKYRLLYHIYDVGKISGQTTEVIKPKTESKFNTEEDKARKKVMKDYLREKKATSGYLKEVRLTQIIKI